MASPKPSRSAIKDTMGPLTKLRSADYLGEGFNQPEGLLAALRAAQTKGSICFDAVKRRSRSRSILSARQAKRTAESDDVQPQGRDFIVPPVSTSGLGVRMEAFAKDVMDTELVELYAVLHHNASGSRPNSTYSYTGRQALPRLGSRKRPRPTTTQEGLLSSRAVGQMGNQASDPPAACPPRPNTFSGPLPGLTQQSTETPQAGQGECADWASGGRLLELSRVPTAPLREAADHFLRGLLAQTPASSSPTPFGSRGHSLSPPESSRPSNSRGVVGLLGSEQLRELRARGYLPPGTSIDNLQRQADTLLLPVSQWGEDEEDVDLDSPLVHTVRPFAEPVLQMADLFDKKKKQNTPTRTQRPIHVHRPSTSQEGSRARPSTTAGSSLSPPPSRPSESALGRPGTGPTGTSTKTSTSTSTRTRGAANTATAHTHNSPSHALAGRRAETFEALGRQDVGGRQTQQEGRWPRRAGPDEAAPAEELWQAAHKLQERRLRIEKDALAMQHNIGLQVERMKEDFERNMSRLAVNNKRSHFSSPRKGESGRGHALEVMGRANQRRRLATQYMALGKWKALTQALKHKQEHTAALRLQAWTRGCLARRRVGKLKQQRLQREKRRLTTLAKRCSKVHKAAVSIQRRVRGHQARGRAREAKLRVQTCRAIQTYLRRIRAKRAAWQRIRRLQHADELATCIQSAYRRHLAQKHTARLRRRRRYEAIDRGLSEYKTAVATAFKFNGAASRIQKWWRNTPYRFQLLVRRAQAKRRRAVLLIQGYIRVFLAKRAAKHFREHRARLLLPPVPVDDLLATRRESGSGLSTTLFDIGFKSLALATSKRRPSPDKLAGSRGAKFTLSTDLAGGLSLLSATVHKGVALSARLIALVSPQRAEQRRQEIRARAAVRIQKLYRGFQGRQAVAAARETKAIKASVALAPGLLRTSNKERRKRHRAAWIINTNVAKWVRRRQRLNAAAVRIQRHWRGFVCRGRYRVLRRQAGVCVVLVQAKARGFLTRLHLQQQCQRLRVRYETVLAGKGLYAATLEHEKKRQLLQGARLSDVGAMLELQRLFLYYTAAQGRFTLKGKAGKGEPALLECSRLVRFCNAMSGLLSRDLTARHVEKLFEEVLCESTGGTGRAMEYADFISLIQRIANARLPKIDRFGRFVGDDARFIKLLLDHILPAPTSKRILERLDKAQAYPARAKANVLQSISTIQRVWRGSVSRSKINKIRDSAWDLIRQGKGDSAATIIQCAFRRHNARRTVCRRANEVYVKHEEAPSRTRTRTGSRSSKAEAVSFYNPRTGRLLSKMPRLFFKHDYGLAVPQPDPDRAVVLNCNVCTWQAASVYCVECGDYYCGAHFLQGHRKGKAALHPTLPTDQCAHCSVLVASRYCKRCDDKFCDTCFIALHRRGQLAHHPSTWLTPECAVCHNYMARRVCDTCDQILLCIPCADQQHQVYNGHNVRALPYRPRAIQQHEAGLCKDREARALEELFRQRMASIREHKQHRAAILIQKHWRGYSARKPVAHLLGWARRKFRELDDVTRNSICYKILEWWGVAPELSSDSTKERVLKRFPHWARALVTDCVDGDWATSLAMVLEKEQWAKDRQKALDSLTLKELFHEEAGAWLLEPLQLAALRARLLRMDIQRGALDKELKVAQHHVSKATKKNEREDAKREVKLVRGELASLEEARKQALAKMERIHAARAARKGPDRLEQRVQDFKHYGRALPIVLDTKQAAPVFRCAKARAASVLQQGARYRVGHDQRQAGIYVVHRVKERRRGNAQYAVLQVDRDWMDASAHGVPIFRLPKLPFHEHLAYRLSYALQQTSLVQGPVALAMGAAHYLAQWLSALAANLDEDSQLRGRLTWAAERLRQWRDSLARRYRFRYLRLAESLRLRAVLEQAQAWTKGLEKAAARRLKQIQDARRPRDPYEQWEESPDKRDVTVVWRRDEGEGGIDEVLGVIRVDIDMPITILREKIRRRLRDPLNARNGEGFIFLKKEEPLPVFYEERQRGTDLVVSKMDEVSKEHTTLCLIFKDPDRPFAQVPVLKDYEPDVQQAPSLKLPSSEAHPEEEDDKDKDDYWAV